MIYHPQTISIYHLLHPNNFDSNSLSTIDSFKLDIAKNIITCFLLYPTLKDLMFDFKEIDRISKVWEGSDEETVSIGEFSNFHNFQQIPYFSSISDSLNQINLKYYNNNEETQKELVINSSISILFNFLTEEPSFTTELLHHFSNKKDCKTIFSLLLPDESFNLLLESEFTNFLGSSLVSKLRHHSLSQTITINNIKEKSKNKL